MEQFDLIIETGELTRSLSAAVKNLQTAGVKRAEAESEYRQALSKEILIQREAGLPVTIMSDVVRGKREIAKLKLKRDIQTTNYDVCLEYIYATKLKLRLLENQISREWGQAKND